MPLLGFGPGSTTIGFGSSSINWYLTLLVENGILATMFILLFIFASFLRIVKSKVNSKDPILLGFLSSIIHLASFTAFYDPAIWVLLIIFNICDRNFIRTKKVNYIKILGD